MRYVKLFFAISLLVTSLHASDTSKYVYAKKNYVTAVLKDNKSKEIRYLKDIIKYGKKLGKNVSRYETELQKIDKTKRAKIQKKSLNKSSSKYGIKSVYSDKNQIIINFNHKISKKYIKFSETKNKNGYQDIFDISGRFKDAKPTKLILDTIKKITIFQYRYNTLRIILSNNSNPNTIYIINKKQIIIKVIDKRKKETIIPKKQKTIPKIQNPVKLITPNSLGLITSNKVIVIDAGHGGKDAGAVGPYKRYEKHVTLAVSKYLRDELKAKGFEVYMTRDRDKFISLRYRTKYANKKNADLFLSIHANSTVKRNAHKSKGIETYFLSPARSERAKRVAAKENQADMNSMGYNSQNILLTLLNNSKIISSQKMAIDVQKNILYELRKIYGKKSIVDGGVREAPFWVLVGAQMPAVLVELGYISHPTESKRLYNKSYQKHLAKGMAKGIIDYFKHNQ
jgi:N-acetylmuramoyl-L-alanine amidase